MTEHAPTECIEPGCANLVERGGRCSRCREEGLGRRDDTRRGSARARGYGTRWERARRRHLELEPWCRECRKPGRDVDHVIPHQGAEWLFWLPGNLQTLCHRDHSRKTVEEREGIPIGIRWPTDLPRPVAGVRRVLIAGPEVGHNLEGFTIDATLLELEVRNDLLRKRLGDTRLRQLNLVVPAPRVAERAFWTHVMGTSANVVEPAVKGIPSRWWELYERDQRAEKEMRLRGWAG